MAFCSGRAVVKELVPLPSPIKLLRPIGVCVCVCVNLLNMTLEMKCGGQILNQHELPVVVSQSM